MNSNQRLWALAAAVSVVMVVVPLASCGTPKGKCTPSSCFGCCDANDQCQPGTSTTACGASANMCTSCAFGSLCNLGICSTGGTGGGSGGGTGGGSGGGTGGGMTGGGTGGGATGGGSGGGTGGGTTGGGTGGGTTGGGTGGGGGTLLGDTCATAQTLNFVNGTATFTGSTSGYTHDLSSTCANPGQPDRVITFTQPTTGEMTFRLVSSGFRPALSVHNYSSGSCLTEINCFPATAVGATIDHMQIVPAGTYAIVIDSASTGSGSFTLTATRVTGVDSGPPPTATPLQNGVSRTISGIAEEVQYFTITVPSGVSILRFATTGGTGDVDLYAAQGAPPDPQTPQFKSEMDGNEELIEISAPVPGVYYLVAFGFAAYSGVSLTATY
jgi:hypothetical protein